MHREIFRNLLEYRQGPIAIPSISAAMAKIEDWLAANSHESILDLVSPVYAWITSLKSCDRVEAAEWETLYSLPPPAQKLGTALLCVHGLGVNSVVRESLDAFAGAPSPEGDERIIYASGENLLDHYRLLSIFPGKN